MQVYRVPEMATILLPGGVNFAELSAEAAEKFQVGEKSIIITQSVPISGGGFECFKSYKSIMMCILLLKTDCRDLQ